MQTLQGQDKMIWISHFCNLWNFLLKGTHLEKEKELCKQNEKKNPPTQNIKEKKELNWPKIQYFNANSPIFLTRHFFQSLLAIEYSVCDIDFWVKLE